MDELNGKTVDDLALFIRGRWQGWQAGEMKDPQRRFKSGKSLPASWRSPGGGASSSASAGLLRVPATTRVKGKRAPNHTIPLLFRLSSLFNRQRHKYKKLLTLFPEKGFG